MLTIYLLTAFALSATSAVAIEQRRYSRSHGDGRISISVHPKFINMKKGESIAVKCRAKGGVNIENRPFVTFYVSTRTYSTSRMIRNSFPID